MSSSISNSSIVRSRSLRIPATTLKLPTASTSNPSTQSVQGPSNIALFLTNLRLLDLDLRDDWPDISTKTFSTTKDAQNQKKRIQCVEWALYQLFALWDPEETCNKLQPFFPPLEHLQSLNLRAALFRCLDQTKKNGVLGRDTVLRKTMLDECKGERLDEILAVFSNAVLKKVLLERDSQEHEAIAQQLAYENFSYTGERTALSALILAHKASLSKHLREKEATRARYEDFSELLKLNERRISRRHEQLKEVFQERGSYDQISSTEVRELQNQVQKNWSGNEEWLKTILSGASKVGEDGILATKFDKLWKHVENGSIGDVEHKTHVGLLEQLDARVKDQENRLARWQDFGKSISKSTSTFPSKKAESTSTCPKKIDLGFNQHQTLQVDPGNSDKTVQTNSASLEEYNRLIENMRSEIADVRAPRNKTSRPPRQSQTYKKRASLLVPSSVSPQREPSATEDVEEEGWSSASESNEHSPGFTSHASKSTSQTPPGDLGIDSSFKENLPEVPPTQNLPIRENARTMEKDALPELIMKPPLSRKTRSPSPLPPHTPPREASPEPNKLDDESDLADQILNSMSTASPSPKKPRHTLSLAERTRLSMSRASHSQYSDLHDDFDLQDLPRLPIKPRPSMAPKAPSSESEGGLHADLIERTRKSMVGFEAAQKKAQLERRKSVKDAKKKQRESSYFPKVAEEVVTPDVSAVELIDGDPDYESVFKSRPKIKTSPAVSPTRIEEGEYEDD